MWGFNEVRWFKVPASGAVAILSIAVIADGSIGRRQAEPDTFSGLRGEERSNTWGRSLSASALPNRSVDANGVHIADARPVRRQDIADLFGGQVRDLDLHQPGTLDRIDGIQQDVHDRGLQHAVIAQHAGPLTLIGDFKGNPLVRGPAKQLDALLGQLMQVDRHLLGEASSAQTASTGPSARPTADKTRDLVDLTNQPEVATGRLADRDQVQIALNTGQEVVEIMRDPAAQKPKRLQLFGLAQRVARTVFLGDIAKDRTTPTVRP